jgi:hypothetical protein
MQHEAEPVLSWHAGASGFAFWERALVPILSVTGGEMRRSWPLSDRAAEGDWPRRAVCLSLSAPDRH